MCFEKVTSPDVVNKLFRVTKLQKVIEEFIKSDELAVHILVKPGEYSSIRTAQASYCSAIRRMGAAVSARTLKGELYLIRNDLDWKPDEKQEDPDWICKTCTHKGEHCVPYDDRHCSMYESVANVLCKDCTHRKDCHDYGNPKQECIDHAKSEGKL